jgi:hypothetical protein
MKGKMARARRKLRKKKKRKTQVKIRKPTPRGGWAHKTEKDYDRKRDKKVTDDD